MPIRWRARVGRGPAVVAVLAAFVGAWPAAVRAEDWEVKRTATAPRLAAQYLAALRRDPWGTGLDRLLALAGRGRGLESLSAQLAAGAAKGSGADAVLLARIRSASGDEAGAEEALRTAIELRPTDGRVKLMLAGILGSRGSRPEVKALLEAALPRLSCSGAGSRCAGAARQLAEIALDAGDADGAKRWLARLTTLGQIEVELSRRLAEQLTSAGRSDEALAAWRALEAQRGLSRQERAAALRQIASLLLARGELAAAKSTLQRARRVGGGDERALFDEELAVARQQGTVGAMLGREERMPPASRTEAGWLRLATLLEELGRRGDAVVALRRAHTLLPRAPALRRRLVEALERAGHREEAVAEMRRAVAEAPGDLALRIEVAERLSARGGALRAEGIRLLREGSRRAASDAAAHRLLLAACDRAGDGDGALAEQEALVRLAPRDEHELIALGERFWQRGDHPRAVETWRGLLALKPGGQGAALLQVSRLLGDHEQWPEAIMLGRRAVAQSASHGAGDGDSDGHGEGDGSARRSLALLYERAGRGSDAEQEWRQLAFGRERALRSEARHRLVQLWTRTGRLGEQVPALSQRFGGVPPDPAAGLLLAAVMRQQGRAREAAEVLDRLLAQGASVPVGDRAEALEQRGELLRASGRLPEALSSLAAAAELAPARATQLLGDAAEVAFALHRDEEALAYARRAVTAGDGAAALRLAALAERAGRMDEAEAALRKAVAVPASELRARSALARLRLLRGDAAGAQRMQLEIALRAPDEATAIAAAERAAALGEARGALAALEAPLQASGRPLDRRALALIAERRAASLLLATKRGEGAAAAPLDAMVARLRPMLIAALGDGDPPTVRSASAVLFAAGGAPDPAAARALLDWAADPASDRVGSTVPIEARANAAAVASRDPRLVPWQRWRDLARSPEKELRLIAVAALGSVDWPGIPARGTSALWDALEDPHPDVRAQACLGLAYRRPPSGPGPLLARQLSAADQPPATRAACALALAGAIAGDGAGRFELLAQLLAAADARVRRAALVSLARSDPQRARQPLLRAALAEEDATARATAVALLAGRPPPPPARPMAVREPVPAVEREIDELTIARIEPVSPPAYDPMLLAEVGRVLAGPRRAALRLLAELDARADGIGLGMLSAGLAELPAPERARAEAELARLGEHLVPHLSKLTGSADRPLRARAVALLGKLRVPFTDERIAPALHDPQLADDLAIALSAPGQSTVRARLRAHLATASATEKQALAPLLQRLPQP